MSDLDGASDLWVLVYGGASVAPTGEAELRALREESRRNNERLGVTGMLLYRGGNFLQVLEGGERAVSDLYRRIRADRRHRGCHAFLSCAKRWRMFPGWTMALRTDADLTAEHRRALDAFARDAHGPDAASARAVAKLIGVFHRIMTRTACAGPGASARMRTAELTGTPVGPLMAGGSSEDDRYPRHPSTAATRRRRRPLHRYRDTAMSAPSDFPVTDTSPPRAHRGASPSARGDLRLADLAAPPLPGVPPSGRPAALGESEARRELEALGRTHAVIEFDLRGEVLSANATFGRVMGYPAEELVGKRHSLLVDEAYARSREYAAFWGQLADGVPQSARFRRPGSTATARRGSGSRSDRGRRSVARPEQPRTQQSCARTAARHPTSISPPWSPT
jgi:PAS domain S-box-containing protein